MEYNVFQNNRVLDIIKDKDWAKLYNLLDIFGDDTKNAKKIKKEEYLENGKYPIVDQGQLYIAGYSNNVEGLYEDYPIILFGDHTRALKYIDFPVFIGADGVKLLKLKSHDEGINVKFVYYFLKNVELPSDGYSRHFKYLKQVVVPIPDRKIQDKIVEVLDKSQELINKRKEQIEALDELVKSKFIEMFGDPTINKMAWNKVCWDEIFDTTTGKLDSNAMVEGGKYPFFTCAKEVFWIDEYAFDCEALLLAGNNAAGIYDVKYYNGKFNAYQRTYVLTLKNSRLSYILFKYQLENKLLLLKHQSKGSNTRYLTLGILKELDFIVPPIELQNQFADFVKQVDEMKLKMEKSLKELEDNFNSLMQKAFKGELF